MSFSYTQSHGWTNTHKTDQNKAVKNENILYDSLYTKFKNVQN